ncbi:MAG: Lrp/AsnC family transcriptional regulator, partial [Ktedonobacterales bacterium]
MTNDSERLLDDTGWELLCALQENARSSYAELGKRVGLTAPAVAERIRRMEVAGIITGYHAAVNPAKLGLAVA